MTRLSAEEYRKAVDNDAFPWYRFPNYSDEEKLLTHMTMNNEQRRDSQQAPIPFGAHPFRGQFGTTFQPPGFEREVTWYGNNVKHPPAGLSLPQHLATHYGSPKNRSQSAPSIAYSSSVNAEDHKVVTTATEQHLAAPSSVPTSTGISDGEAKSCGKADVLKPVKKDLASLTMGDLAWEREKSEVKNDTAIDPRPLIVSSEGWPLQRRSTYPKNH